ncbi:MAG: tripartite tricarboxylate transporter substrate binding protein [Betaproteobacteria bacterium]|nr:tripartite tricarboxylate transporter substrate binding protein [Betaproteobacteria bacterium]
MMHNGNGTARAPRCGALLAGCAIALAAPNAPGASDEVARYPDKPIRIVVGFTAGSVVDVSARVVGQKMFERWKQQVVIDNRPSAGGIIAAQIVAGANPDGYTLLSVSASHAVAPAIYAKLPYDTVKDFAGITTTVNSPAVLVVNRAIGVKSVKELIALAKSKPGQLNFASAGMGSATHFSAELFKSMAGIEVVHVPYKGIPEALTDTMTGRVQYFLSPMAIALPFIKEGKVLALGVSPARRVSVLPDVPTIAEAGLPGYRWDTWFGLLAPAKTPRPLINKLNGEITRILNLPDVRERWTALGTEPIPSTPAGFDKLVASQIEVLTKLARAANIKAN